MSMSILNKPNAPTSLQFDFYITEVNNSMVVTMAFARTGQMAEEWQSFARRIVELIEKPQPGYGVTYGAAYMGGVKVKEMPVFYGG